MPDIQINVRRDRRGWIKSMSEKGHHWLKDNHLFEGSTISSELVEDFAESLRKQGIDVEVT